MAVDLAQVVACMSSGQDTASLRQAFKSVHASSCPTVYNFHMHTICSDGRLQPEVLMQQAIAIGLKGLAITDHHTVNGYAAAQAWLDAQQYSLEVVQRPSLWIGVEVTASLLDVEVHILGYGFDPQNSAMQPYLQGYAPIGETAQAGRVIGAIQAAGGLVILAHPVRYRRSPEELIAAAVEHGIDGVETYYSYDNPCPWRTSPKQTERVAQISQSYGLLNSCGTDTHGLSLLQRL